jgi:hypothetical protein
MTNTASLPGLRHPSKLYKIDPAKKELKNLSGLGLRSNLNK